MSLRFFSEVRADAGVLFFEIELSIRARGPGKLVRTLPGPDPVRLGWREGNSTTCISIYLSIYLKKFTGNFVSSNPVEPKAKIE